MGHLIGEEWLTPSKRRKLKENGIPERIYYQRIYKRGWTIKKALNTPYKKKASKHGELLETAYKNGVEDIFHNRIRAGYPPKEAAKMKRHESMIGNQYAKGNKKT